MADNDWKKDKTSVDATVETGVSVVEFKALQKEMGLIVEANKELAINNESLKLTATKTRQQVVVEKYAGIFEDKEIVDKFDKGDVKYEGALISLLDGATKYCEDVKSSFKKTAPKSAGSFSEDDVDDKSAPKNIKEATLLVKVDNPKATPSEIYRLVRSTYTHLYGKGSK